MRQRFRHALRKVSTKGYIMVRNADYAKEAAGCHLSETFHKSVHPLGNLESRVRGHLSIVHVGIKKHA